MANNKFCTDCGNEIDVTSNFCTKCGNKLIIDVNSQTKTTKKKSSNTLQNKLIIGGVLFGILLIIILFSRESDSYSAEEKYYPLKTFSGDSTEESGPFLSTSFSINSNKIKLVGIKKQFTNILTICIDSSDDKAPIPKIPIRPVYPEIAQEAGIEGTVYIQFFIDARGNVTEAWVLKGIPNTGLNEAALDAVKKSKWKPAQQRDKKVGVWQTVPVKFELTSH